MAKKEEKNEEKKAEKTEEETSVEEVEEAKASETNSEEESKDEKSTEVTKKKRTRVAVVHVFSSKNDTIITATDLSGAETLAWSSGGMVVKSHREEGRPYAAMQAATRVINTLKDKGVYLVHVRIRAPGGVGSKTPGGGAQAVVRTIARTGVRIGRIEDVTPLPTDSMKRKGGRRGRRV